MPRLARLLPLLTAALLATAFAQPEEGTRLVLEVGAPRDSLSFTAEWWGLTDPHYWISTDGNPHDLLRFTGVDVPRGATILEAVVTVWSFNAASDDPGDHVTVWIEQVDDAAPLEGPADAWARKDAGGRTARWPTTRPGRDRPQPSPDLSALLQEIVDRPGWERGNAVRFFAEATPTPVHDGRQVHSYYTGAAGATRARLEVVWTETPPPAALPRRVGARGALVGR